MDWQPISTYADWDKPSIRTVLLYGPKCGVGTGWRDDDDGVWRFDMWSDFNDACEPTHWMPLPAPPAEQKAEAA